MEISGKVAVVTGAAGGIGLAMARALAKAGARVAICDLDAGRIAAAAEALGVPGLACDVTDAAAVQSLIKGIERDLGPVDIWVSNAGVGFGEPDHAASAPVETWETCWQVNVMAHVHAARALLPGMIARGNGYLVNTASAAGLLAQVGDAAYSATKHAAVSFAESLAIAHGDDGIKVSVICPQYVATPMLGFESFEDAPAHPGLIAPEDVAQALVAGIEAERFLILPHPVVAEYWQAKAADPERWLRGMRKLRRTALDQVGTLHPGKMHKLV
ncbi:SDR family NAD(P)-dependent oxidoreductase [Mesobacterium pallidum]|uniref:SDR family NAD(P)-dependent oxidoreductase n=1 Tax=Mesobacterium pallidum TaxID=2872037 RepID=UPI001EE281B5|nr:SDR family oxidoreductase [Mesobacterium pallidum]